MDLCGHYPTVWTESQSGDHSGIDHLVAGVCVGLWVVVCHVRVSNQVVLHNHKGNPIISVDRSLHIRCYVELLAAQTGPLNWLCSLEKKIDKATKELKAKTTKKPAKKKPASKK